MPVFHTKTIENILEPVAQQLHYVLAMAEKNATSVDEVRHLGTSMPNLDRFASRSALALSRASSRRSIPEYITPDTVRHVVNDDDCPVCQLMMPRGKDGCVSRLVILHEEANDGNAMPDLTGPVGMVSRAVGNLIQVGYDTCDHSDDRILQQDMPPALQRVEGSSKLLEESSYSLKHDPYSVPARKKLIDGARGILQGTSALLLCFDESEVRKIIRVCRKANDYVAVSEVIESMADLQQFVKDISPVLHDVTNDVNLRQQELTHQVHREILIRCMDSIKVIAPILICSMKTSIELGTPHPRQGHAEAIANRNFMSQRMTEEMNEIIRVLQLTTYDEDEWDADNVTVMRKALSAAKSLLTAALDWLADPHARSGAVGEKAIRRICEYADRISARALPEDAQSIKRSIFEITSFTDELCNLRNNGQPDRENLAAQTARRLKDLVGSQNSSGLMGDALQNAQRHGGANPAHTAAGRLEQALRWLDNPGLDDGGLGLQALRLLTADARKLADRLNPQDRNRLLGLCSDIDRLAAQLADLERRGLGNSPEAHQIRNQLKNALRDLGDFMRRVLTDRVVDDFADITTPLKQFVEAVHADPYDPNREQNFVDKSQRLTDHSQSMTTTARLVASCGPSKSKKTVEAILDTAEKVEQLTPQLVNAGRVRLHNPGSEQHFENIHKQYADALHRLRSHVDDAIDTGEFVRASETAMRRYTNHCEGAINGADAHGLVNNSSQIARLGNRVLMTAQNEADNSEEPSFVSRVRNAADQLHNAIPPMVNNAKQIAQNPHDQYAAQNWRGTNDHLLNSVRAVGDAITGVPMSNGRHSSYQESISRASPYNPPPPSSQVIRSVNASPPTAPIIHNKMIIREDIPAPPRPPPPVELSPPPRPPPPPEYDEEEETRAFWERYPLPQASHQPMLAAAHNLHNELKQWSSQENDIVAAAKRMAILMARLSQLVRGEGGTKKDLINCSKAIADSSEEVTRLAVQLARLCTDIKMRTALLQVSERIPTIATQLKVLSTVKATMLGSASSEEDDEAMQQLVHNAQNLMQSVKDVVRAAEAASIKIRTNSGLRLRWLRKPMWSNF
ncbi:Vinculin [Caenorhabditis elegans]|uniref:Isoform e of Vinculin n=2 Tax=Caenorhabditis elegans TaxID=6239 RepID=P19826-5|nr:Vinculin [Caenorhabditis elegans]CDK13446.1 Vinculin [Caenorhabditis elegans]|eukprot:NP_001293744.1 Vinculin [Caenorhabditis elegans]